MVKKKTKSYSTKEILAKAKKDKPPKQSFEEIVTGHKFKVVKEGKTEEGSHFWCAFCGGRGKNYIEIVRDDDKKYKVGRNCLSKVGLKPPEKPPKLVKKDAPLVAAQPDKVVLPPKTEKEVDLDDDIKALLNSL